MGKILNEILMVKNLLGHEISRVIDKRLIKKMKELERKHGDSKTRNDIFNLLYTSESTELKKESVRNKIITNAKTSLLKLGTRDTSLMNIIGFSNDDVQKVLETVTSYELDHILKVAIKDMIIEAVMDEIDDPRFAVT